VSHSPIDPTLHTAALAGLEMAINGALRWDPGSRQKLQQLAGHVFHFQCQSPHLSLYLLPTREQLRLCAVFEGSADTTLTGSASDFAMLARASDPANALINGELQLQGDSGALITLQSIVKQLDLDWEAPLANLFGDVIGHSLGRGIRRGLSFGRRAMTGATSALSEFLQQESELLASPAQLALFYSEVSQLSMRADRLEARIDKLARSKKQQ